MTISLLIDTSGGSNFEGNNLRNVGTLHVGGSALAVETLDVTGTAGISSSLKVDTILEFTSAAGITVDGVVIKDSGATFAGDIVQGNGFGIIVGHTALLAVAETTSELQVLGTAATDGSITIGRYSADINPAALRFYKSRAAIGSLATVVTGDELGAIRAYGDDGTDAATRSSAIIFDTEGTVSTGQVPGIIRIQVAAAGTLADALTIDSAKAVALLGAVAITGATTAAAITASGIIKTDDTTDATSGTDGSLQTDGGLSVMKDIVTDNDIKILNGGGIIVGHTAQLTIGGNVDEVQVLGTATADSRISVGKFVADNTSPVINFLKSRAAIGSFTVIVTGDAIGEIDFLADDGTDYATLGAAIRITSEGTIGSNRIPTKMEFQTGTDAAPTVVTTALTLDSAQAATFAGVALFAAGSESAPGIAISGDPDTGLIGLTNIIGFSCGGTERMRVNANATLFINDTANADMSGGGITINQLAVDDEILAFKSSDVAHGFTDLAETDTFGFFQKNSAAIGGLRMSGLSESGAAIRIHAFQKDALNTTKSSAGFGAIDLIAATASGSGATNPAADSNLVSIRNDSGTAFFLFDTEGSGHSEVEWTTYDKHNDMVVLRDIEAAFLPDQFGAALEYSRKDLEALDVVHGFRIHNGKTRAMVNWTRLAMLQHGALQQLGSRVEYLEQKLLAA